jgi:hypothetical protein
MVVKRSSTMALDSTALPSIVTRVFIRQETI